MLSQQRAKGRKTTTSDTLGRKHTTKACTNCRKRKAKCDGVQPCCSTCTLYKDDCTWSENVDARRTARKGEVAALRERIKTLESLLKGSGQEVEREGGGSGRVRTELIDSEEDDGSEGEDAVQVLNEVGISRLKLDENGLEFTNYGPTSAFQHLPSPPIAQTRLSASPQSFPRSPIAFAPTLEAADAQGPIEWNKYLPLLELEGWDESLHDSLLALFFSYFNNWCYWVEEGAFRSDLRTLLSITSTSSNSRTSYYSPLLHLVVLAIACSYSDDTRTSQEASVALVRAAKERIDEEGERPSIATLRGLLLLGSWHSGRGYQGLGNLYAGMGLRMSQTLGLGIDASGFVKNGILPEELRRTRDYAMWTAYIQDKLWSSYVGRNCTLHLENLQTPAPCIDSALDSQVWQPLANSTRRTPALSNLTLCFFHTTKLATMQERVLTTLYGLISNVTSVGVLNQVSDLNLKLESWMSKLPDSLRVPPQLTKPPPGHVILLNALYHFVVILLYRPYYNLKENSLPIHDVAVKRCNAASSRIISLFELFEQAPGLRYAPVTMTQICFAAGTTQLLSSVNSNGKKASDAKEAALRCVSALKEMGRAFECASQTGKILERLVDQWAPKDSPMSDTAANEPSISTVIPQNPQLLDPESELAKQLVLMGWQPPPSVTEASTSALPISQPNIFPSPPPNPLSLQNGFASAFSQQAPPHLLSPHQPYDPIYSLSQPPQQQQHIQPYDPTNAWIQASLNQGANSMMPMPDDVFASMLSLSGRGAMGMGGEGGELTNGGLPWYF
ncbi:hypothetical protein JCM5353_008564 [Sporobolomyces roseus]